MQERVSQTVRPQPSPTHAPAGSWVESRLARARSPYHLPYTSPASLPYTTYLPTQAAYPIPPTYPATPPQQPTLYHTPVSQVAYPTPAPPQTAYPTPRPPPTPSRLPYPSQPAYPTPAAHGCPVAPRRPTLYPPFVACRRPASRSLGRSFVAQATYPTYPRLPTSLPYPTRIPTSKDTPSRPTLYRTRGSRTRRRDRPRPRPKRPTLHHSTPSHQRTWPRTSVPTRLPYTSRPVATCAAPTTNTTTFSP